MATNSDFTIADVLAWARTKPAGERYRYSDAENCACAQFVRAQGLPIFSDGRSRLELKLAALILDTPYYDGWRAFGDLAERLAREVPAEPISNTWTRPDAYLTDIEAVAVSA